ncbi:MAG: biotin-dependent carboxyltransferase family protein [Burkholderiales bacterium]
MTIIVIKPGLLSTVQDLGRFGWQHLGIVPSGAMDIDAHRLANLLVGNGAGAATIEITVRGPELEFEQATLVALCGATFDAKCIDAKGKSSPMLANRPVLLSKSARLRIADVQHGARAYIAVAGGIAVPPVLGSASTYLPAGFGGYQGRALRTGDRLPLDRACSALSVARFASLKRRTSAPADPNAMQSVSWSVPIDSLPHADEDPIRFIEGRHWRMFSAAAHIAIETGPLRIAPESNRIGYRLTGITLERRKNVDVLSEPTCLGTIQVPSDGTPIVLMADHQTTGGYAKIGEVAGADIPRLAQRTPGMEVRFRRCTLADARAARKVRQARVAALVQTIAWEYAA